MTTIERLHHRVEVQLAAHIQQGETRRSAVIRDLSIGGAFVATSEPCAYGEPVTIETHLPGIEGDTVLKATVRWVNKEGCGVQFEPMGARETHAIIEAVKR